jgi:hypothetical protein
VTNVALEARDRTLRDQLRARENENQIKSRALSEAFVRNSRAEKWKCLARA